MPFKLCVAEVAMEHLLGLGEVVRRNSGAVRNRDVPLPPRLPSEALAYISVAGLRTLQAQPYSPDFPVPYGTSVILGFRTCSPLRGSSGFSPDSLLMPLAEQPWRKPLYLAFLSTASPLDVDILLKERVAQVLSNLSLASETPPLMRLSLSSNWSLMPMVALIPFSRSPIV